MGTAAGLLAEARKSLGLRGRPNYITRSYATRHGSGFLAAPWCDMSITYWARQSANTAAVLPGGDRAYTVWHADDFRKIGRWHTGTIANLNRSKPGDIVFFDWGQSNSIGAIDHVGVIERVLGDGRVQTIEGNTGDACLRRVRSASVIAGYGRPAYSSGTTTPPQEEDMPTAKEIAEAVWSHNIKASWVKPGDDDQWQAGTHLGVSHAHVRNLETLVAGLAAQWSEGVDEDAIVTGVLAGLPPERIAAAIPAELASQVAAELATRLES